MYRNNGGIISPAIFFKPIIVGVIDYKSIVSGAASTCIGPFPPVQIIITNITHQEISTVTPIETVIPRIAAQHVIAGPADKGIIAGKAIKRVVSAAPIQAVVTIGPIESVLPIAANQC
ncbi:hypothetical protein [Niveispirillum sp. BGYR6]|uniref:hypothetical protein n=1 Tax=Niveispirillum sp. BGYR6 TaxID=2971249 RepID=UPI0022B9AFC8|nr:hypothetical protein [Niveispirillum sp. BGYR6]MDG5497954.1 hypothetical protein [Niveispirillum sp. BGYR6]